MNFIKQQNDKGSVLADIFSVQLKKKGLWYKVD